MGDSPSCLALRMGEDKEEISPWPHGFEHGEGTVGVSYLGQHQSIPWPRRAGAQIPSLWEAPAEQRAKAAAQFGEQSENSRWIGATSITAEIMEKGDTRFH